MNKGLIMEKLLEDLEIFDENHLYNRLRKRENLNDSDLALIVSDLIIEQKEQINSNSLVTLINLLKLIINNNCLAKYTISTIYEKINNSLQKEGSKESYLLLNNLRNYLNCILEVNSNEHQIRTFYERQLNDSKREIKNLKKLLDKDNKRIKELEKSEKNHLKKLNEKKRMLQEREQQLTKLKAQLNNEQVKENNEEVLTMIQKNEIKDYLLMNLEDVKSKEELFQLAKSFNISESNFNIIFNELCQEYNIASNTLGFPKYYQLMPLKVPKNQTFFLPTNEKQIDILMIADLHIRNVSNYLKSLMYLLNNYAIKNNISLATILGDIYDIRWDDFDKNKYDFIKFWEKNAFQLKREIDKSSLNYLILGGNHDERALLDGIDLIKYLEDDCENVKSLGYQDASLVLGEVKKSENKIGLHHTGKHVILPKPVFISEFENRKIKEYLNNLYLNESRSYFDFFGHFHYDYLNLRDGYSLINNFPNATSPIKAYHLSFYLNDKLNIDRMIIKPLAIYCDEFLPVNEISYQKVRKI